MKNDIDKFLEKVEKTDSCWKWKLSVKPNGYSQTFINGKRVYSHRLAYELFKGQIPDTFHIDHLCRNRSCVNPDHLEAVTPEENVRRGLPFRVPKKSCIHGHLFSDDNVYIDPDGSRNCRTCKRIKNKVRHHRRVQINNSLRSQVSLLESENAKLEALLAKEHQFKLSLLAKCERYREALTRISHTHACAICRGEIAKQKDCVERIAQAALEGTK